MPDFSSVGKWLIFLGMGLIAAGLLILLSGRIPFLGRLPGDIRIERENFSFYFPMATCLLLSAFFSLVLWLISRIK
ncbi:MAG TPA: DUF2905 domain-containing protein [bacterium]|nr:DUF2905 domain-containing protein [bacterium]